MAVISELIQAGLSLKQSGNLSGAIEHFKQLHATYPDQARVMFELAACWRAFGVPEQALPLYRELLAMPASQGLPPKDKPRLYTQLGASLMETGALDEALAIFDEGLRLHPSYRTLRAMRIFALSTAGETQAALVDAFELMLESLAPSRWDIFEDEIKAQVRAMRAELPPDIAASQPPSQESAAAAKAEAGESRRDRIDIARDDADETETEVAITVVKAQPKQASQKKKPPSQMGKRAVRIDISGAPDEPRNQAADDAGGSRSLKIPLDPD